MNMQKTRTARRPVARLARILLEHLRDTQPDAFREIVGQIGTTGLGSIDLPGYSVSMSTAVRRKGEITADLSAAGTAWRGFGFGDRSPMISDKDGAIIVILPSNMELPSAFRTKLLDTGGGDMLLGHVYTTGLAALDSLRVNRVTEEGGDLILHSGDEQEGSGR